MPIRRITRLHVNNLVLLCLAIAGATVLASGQTKPAAAALPADPLRRDLVTDCDRLAASPLDPQRPNGVEGIAFDHIDRLEIPGRMLEGRGYHRVLRLPSVDVSGKIQRIRIHLDEIRRGIAGNNRAVRIGIRKAVEKPFFLEQASDEIEVALAVLDRVLADRAG